MVDVEFNSVVEEGESQDRCDMCKRAFWDFHSDKAKGRWGDDGFEGILRCYDEPVDFFEGYERDDFREIEPAECDSCDEYDAKGLRFPMELDDILVEDIGIKKAVGHEIGAWVAVRPCAPEFGGKTYLGILVGNMPTQIGLQYDGERKELRVTSDFPNPLIVIPSMSAVTYGCESWWREIDGLDDFRDITDLDIESQPYVAALRELFPDGSAQA